jgi:hypothetical protein
LAKRYLEWKDIILLIIYYIKYKISMEISKNPFVHLLSSLEINGRQYSYFDFRKLNDPRIDSLPIAIKVLL